MKWPMTGREAQGAGELEERTNLLMKLISDRDS